MPSSALHIEPAGRPAAVALAELHAKAFDAPWSADDFAQMIGGASSVVLQALTQYKEPPAGFILLRTIAGEAEVMTLAVDPVQRRRGVARALLDRAMAWAQDHGAETLWLEVADDNLAACRLYAGAGFQEAGRRRAYYSRIDGARDALVMRRGLNTRPA